MGIFLSPTCIAALSERFCTTHNLSLFLTRCTCDMQQVNSNGILWTVVGGGSGVSTFGGDGGPATAAKLYRPMSLAISSVGDIFVADSPNNVVRKVGILSSCFSSFDASLHFRSFQSGPLVPSLEIASRILVFLDQHRLLFCFSPPLWR